MSDVKPNQKVKLFIDSIDVILDCTVKYFDNDRIALNYGKKLLEYSDYLQEGDEVGIKIFTPVGIIVFDAMILDSPLEREFVIEYVESSPKIQRREYTRVPFESKLILEKGSKKIVIAKTLDVSGGGIKFETLNSEDHTAFVPNEKVKITLYIPNNRSVNTYAKIIENNSLPKEHHVLQFIDIDESERERIIKKTFELQMSIQRREFIRIPVVAEIVLEKGKTVVVGKTVNISGGGVKYVTYTNRDHRAFIPNERVRVTINLPNNSTIKVGGKILENQDLPIDNHVLQFIDIDESERNYIIQKTFEVQMDTMQ